MSSKDNAILMGTPINNKKYDSLCNSTSELKDNGQTIGHKRSTMISISSFQLAMTISVIAAIANASFIIVLPIYLGALQQVGSDAFVETTMFNLPSLIVFTIWIVIRWCRTRELPVLRPNTRYITACWIGFLGTLRSILLAYSSLPSRARPELLGLISASVLPNAVIWRYVVLRKGVGVKQLLCATIVLFGLFVTVLPELFNLGTSESIDYSNFDHHNSTDRQNEYVTNETLANSSHTTVAYSWIWLLVLFGSTIPMALSYVLIEREIKSPEVSFVTLVFWTQVFNSVSLAALFWTSFTPNFGTTNSINEFLTSFGRGIYCSFSTDPSCNGCIIPAIIFIIISPCIDTFNILLTKYAEGAIYTTMVMSSAKPLGSIFWVIFVNEGVDGIMWRPLFGIDTILTLVGLVIVVPATCLYAYISNRQDVQSTDKLKDTKQT